MINVKTLAIAALTLCSVPSVAQAEWKGYAGSSCLANNNSANVRRSVTGIINYDDKAQSVICPIIRDKQEEGTLKRARVRVFANNKDEGGWCRMYSKTPKGAIIDWAEESFSGIGLRVLTFEDIDVPKFGHLVLMCRLPGVGEPNGVRKSMIYSYAVREG